MIKCIGGVFWEVRNATCCFGFWYGLKDVSDISVTLHMALTESSGTKSEYKERSEQSLQERYTVSVKLPLFFYADVTLDPGS